MQATIEREDFESMRIRDEAVIVDAEKVDGHSLDDDEVMVEVTDLVPVVGDTDDRTTSQEDEYPLYSAYFCIRDNDTQPALGSDDSSSGIDAHRPDPIITSCSEAYPINPTLFPSNERRKRAEFICLQVSKPSDKEQIGMSIWRNLQGIYISKIDPDGVVARAGCLKKGDQLLSVNHLSTAKSTVKQVARRIHSEPTVTLIVRTKGKDSDPNLVASCVQKPTPDCKVGIRLRGDRGSIVISRVEKDGLFHDSLIQLDHRLMGINGVEGCFDACDAAQVIAEASKFVTLTSRPPRGYATVLSARSEKRKRWWTPRHATRATNRPFAAAS